MGGIAFRAPVLATLFLIVALANLAMPGSSNFVGEFLILLGVFNAKIVIAFVAFIGVVLASVYTLRLFIRSMHNRVGPHVDLARDRASATASSSLRSWRSSSPSRSTRSSLSIAASPRSRPRSEPRDDRQRDRVTVIR